MNDNTSIKIARLITLEKKFRTAENLSELGFVCANELRSVVDYQSALIKKGSGGYQ